jgi:hypothetical protein
MMAWLRMPPPEDGGGLALSCVVCVAVSDLWDRSRLLLALAFPGDGFLLLSFQEGSEIRERGFYVGTVGVEGERARGLFFFGRHLACLFGFGHRRKVGV